MSLCSYFTINHSFILSIQIQRQSTHVTKLAFQLKSPIHFTCVLKGYMIGLLFQVHHIIQDQRLHIALPTKLFFPHRTCIHPQNPQVGMDQYHYWNSQ